MQVINNFQYTKYTYFENILENVREIELVKKSTLESIFEKVLI